jgi:hypothetical protein
MVAFFNLSVLNKFHDIEHYMPSLRHLFSSGTVVSNLALIVRYRPFLYFLKSCHADLHYSM